MNTRLPCVSFKALNHQLPRSDVFGPWELLDALNRENQELGLIIDLTFTTRYYKLEVNTHTHVLLSFLFSLIKPGAVSVSVSVFRMYQTLCCL